MLISTQEDVDVDEMDDDIRMNVGDVSNTLHDSQQLDVRSH